MLSAKKTDASLPPLTSHLCDPYAGPSLHPVSIPPSGFIGEQISRRARNHPAGGAVGRSDIMTSVNSPACLLARNHFKRSPWTVLESSGRTDASGRQRHRQMPLWVTVTIPPGFPGGFGTRGLWVSLVLGSSSLPRTSLTKPSDSPANPKGK
ncbi:unnamed protein product [Arctogadus glacialis]